MPLLLVVLLFGCGGEGSGGTSGAPQIVSFTANPANIAAAGQPIMLSWEITGGVTSLELDNGLGAVTGTSTIVYPTEATTYTLTAGNSSGSSDATATVSLGGGGPPAEDGQPPTGTFGVSLTQADFQSDANGDITSPSDPRIIRLQPNSTFYVLVSYSNPGGIAGIRIRLANSSPAGLRADLV